jgi:hypothetical protein
LRSDPGLFTAFFDMLMLGGILTWFGCLFVTCMLLEEKTRSPLGGFHLRLHAAAGADLRCMRTQQAAEANGGSGRVANRHQQQCLLGCGRPLQEARRAHH